MQKKNGFWNCSQLISKLFRTLHDWNFGDRYLQKSGYGALKITKVGSMAKYLLIHRLLLEQFIHLCFLYFFAANPKMASVFADNRDASDNRFPVTVDLFCRLFWYTCIEKEDSRNKNSSFLGNKEETKADIDFWNYVIAFLHCNWRFKCSVILRRFGDNKILQ